MTVDLGTQIRDYAQTVDAAQEPLGIDDLMVDYLQQRPDGSDKPAERKGWSRVVVAVAATILAVVGVVVVADGNGGDADGNGGDVETDPASLTTDPVPSPSVADPVTSADVADPVAVPSVFDPVSSYRWSRVPDDDGAFTHLGIYEAGFGGHDRGTYSESADRRMASVIVGGPGLVAVGTSGPHGGIEEDNDDAAVWTSVDGVSWSPVSHVGSALGGLGNQQMTSVTRGGPGLVAVGFDQPKSVSDGGAVWSAQRAAVWTSVDGLTWSRVPHDESVFGGAGGRRINSVTVGGPGLVAVGAQSNTSDWVALEDDLDAAVWVSTDGLTWSRVAHDESVFGGSGPQQMTSVTAGGPGLVAVGTDGLNNTVDAAVWTSVDGITWSRVPDDEAILGGADSQHMSSVTAGGPGLVAVGFDGTLPEDFSEFIGRAGRAAVWTSVDGIIWSRVSDDAALSSGAGSQHMSSVTAGGPGLVAVGTENVEGTGDLRSAVWTSVDGITWARVPDDETVFGGANIRQMNDDRTLRPRGAEMTSVATWGPAMVAVGHTFACCFDGHALDAAVWIATPEN